MNRSKSDDRSAKGNIPSICPYLGLKDDPNTVLHFPSEGNVCYRLLSSSHLQGRRPRRLYPQPLQVSREFQDEVCLTEQHLSCPLFLDQEAAASGSFVLAESGATLPGASAVPGSDPGPAVPAAGLWLNSVQHAAARKRSGAIPFEKITGPKQFGISARKFLIVAAALLLCALAGIVLSRGGFDQFSGFFFPLTGMGAGDDGLAATPTGGAVSTSSLLIRQGQTQESTGEGEYSPFANMITIDAPASSLEPCEPPPGWILYTVKPTDSLFRISVFYGVRMSVLKMVNCLGEESEVRPGDQIYIPPPTTPTPVPSPTPTPTPTRPPYVPPPPTRTSRPQPTRVRPTPTSQPPVGEVTPTQNIPPTSPASPTQPPPTPSAPPPPTPTPIPPISTPTSPPPVP